MPAMRDSKGRFIKGTGGSSGGAAGSGGGGSGESGVVLSGDWDRMDRALNWAVFGPVLTARVRNANEAIGMKFRAMAVRKIRAKEYAPNSPITIILKGSSTPLVHHGNLIKAISYKLQNPFELRVGVIKTEVGEEQVSIAQRLHDGFTMDMRNKPEERERLLAEVGRAMVSISERKPAQRKAMNAAATDMLFGLGGASGKPGIWVIPGRPFLEAVLRDATFQGYVKERWTNAVEQAFREAA